MKKIIILILVLCAHAVQSAVTELNDSNFTDATSDGNVLVKFYGPHCPPCRMSRPVLEQISNSPTYADVQFYEVDIDGRNDRVASRFGIRSMPTFVLLKGGREVDRIVGFDENGLKHSLNKQFGAGKSSKKAVPAPKKLLVQEQEMQHEDFPIQEMLEGQEEEHIMEQPSGELWYTPITDFFKGIYNSIYNFMFR